MYAIGLDCADCDVAAAAWCAYGWYPRPAPAPALPVTLCPLSLSAAEYGLRISPPYRAIDGVALLCLRIGPGPPRASSGGYSAPWSNVSLCEGAEIEVTVAASCGCAAVWKDASRRAWACACE